MPEPAGTERRVHRYPVSFVLIDRQGRAINPLGFALVPLRLIVQRPSATARVHLRYGTFEVSLHGWHSLPGREVHSRHLPVHAWLPDEAAILTVTEGDIDGAALLCEAALGAEAGLPP